MNKEQSQTPRTDYAAFEQSDNRGENSYEVVLASKMRELEMDCHALVEEKNSLLAEKDKEIAMLRVSLEQIVNGSNADARSFVIAKQALSYTQGPTYVHTDKVKPLVEALGNAIKKAGIGSMNGVTTYHLKPDDSTAVRESLAQYRETTGEK